MLPAFDTARTRLRPLAEDDVDFLMALDTSPEVMRYVHNGPLGPDAAQAFAGMQISLAKHRRSWGRWLVETRDSQRRLGWIELYKLSGARRDDLQVGYQFAPEAQGYGYAREALLTLAHYAFSTLQLDRLAAIVRPDNERSRRLLDACGFAFIGEFRSDGAGAACEMWLAYPPPGQASSKASRAKP